MESVAVSRLQSHVTMDPNLTLSSFTEAETKSTFLDTATSELDVRVSSVVLCSLGSPQESDTQSLYRWVTSIIIIKCICAYHDQSVRYTPSDSRITFGLDDILRYSCVLYCLCCTGIIRYF